VLGKDKLDVNQIKQRMNYESYYSSEGLDLYGSGPERTAHCPFHNDRVKSFSVNVETGLWVCHACGQKGDEFTFYQLMHGVGFPEAKAELARLAGVDLNTSTSAPRDNVIPFAKPKSEPPPIPESEVESYHKALMQREKALKFLQEEKGLTVDTIVKYKLGYDGERIIIPIRDEQGAIRNLRRYHSQKKPKMLPYKKGYGDVRFFPIETLKSDEIVICEGEWDCLLAQQMGIPAITQTGGANTWKDEWNELFAGKRIWICYDYDEAGKVGAEKVAKTLAKVAEVRIVELPVTEQHEDFSDWVLKYGGTLEQWQDLMESARLIEYEPGKEDLPQIDAGSGDLADLAEQAWNAIIASNDPPELFQRGGLLTRIQLGDSNDPYLAVVSESALRGILARVAQWYRWTEREGKKDAHPPMPVVKDMMAAPEYPLPVISRVVEAPVFGRQGELNLEPGYHPASRTYYWSNGLEVPPIPDNPTAKDIARARTLIVDELLGDFPFTSATELSHAVALLLVPFAREIIGGPTPLHMIEAPSPGTGKSLLADVVCIPSTSRPAATMTEGRDEDEWRKRITASLIAAPTFILIDNVRRKLDSAALSAALTSTSWQDRILGRSELTTLPVRCIWMATANNPALTTEMARRTVRIRLDAKVARPWQRDGFKHKDLRGWALRNRTELVWAALTLIQAWVAKGMPIGDYVLGQYEAWAQVMGGILDCAGIKGFLGNLDEVYSAADEETAQWEEFLMAWWDEHRSVPQGIRELFRIAQDRDLLLMVRGDKSEHSQKTRMGKALGQMRDRQIGLFRIEEVGRSRSGGFLYRLVNVEDARAEAAAASEVEVVEDDDDDPF
jgi:hypothetical protein